MNHFASVQPKIQPDKYALDDRAFYWIQCIWYSINDRRRWREHERNKAAFRFIK